MIPDNRLYDLSAVAGDVVERVLRLVPQKLIQGPGVQLHGIVKVRGVNRHVLEQESGSLIKVQVEIGVYERRRVRDSLPSRTSSAARG